MPALLKGFLEQVFRPGFALQALEGGRRRETKLKGQSAHVIVTMGMPAFVYRWYFGVHSLKSLERNILRLTGIRPGRERRVCLVDGSAIRRPRRLAKIARAGTKGR